MEWKDFIVSDKEILLGKPVIKGTRISVELILELFENGWAEEMILKNYDHLTHNDIAAVLEFEKVNSKN